jgi:putative serine protease PepD
VIEGSNNITVKLGSGKAKAAKVVGADPSTDLALLKIDTGSGKLTPLKLADSSKVQIGDPTFAIGNPFGLEDTLTTGVISATERDISAPNGFSISGVLQTDAALNPGNSGGPLLNAQGQVIGVNSQIETGGGGGGSGQGSNTGVGFAIPSNTVRNVNLAAAGGREGLPRLPGRQHRGRRQRRGDRSDGALGRSRGPCGPEDRRHDRRRQRYDSRLGG